MTEYYDSRLSKYKCRFRKGFRVQCPIAMWEKWKSAADNKKSFAALITDL